MERLLEEKGRRGKSTGRELLRHELLTLNPFWLNVEDSVYVCFTTFGRCILVSHQVSHGHLRYFFSGYKK